MEANIIKKQIINTLFEYDCKRELEQCNMIIKLNNGKSYNCTNINLLADKVEINTLDKQLKINYRDIDSVYTI